MSRPFEIRLAPSVNVDTSPLLRRGISQCPPGVPLSIVFEPGRHEFHHERAEEHYCFVANNDEGLKRIAIRIADRDGVTIDGQGAMLRTHGVVVPIVIERCRNVVLKHFSLDAAVPFHVEAAVLAVHDNAVDVNIPEEYSYTFEQGRLRFPMPGHTPWEIGNILEFDSIRRETAFKVYDNYGIGERMQVSEIGSRRLRLIADFSHPRPQVGNVLILSGFGRHCPAIVLSECHTVAVEGVAIHQAGGMGVLAQRCQDVRLENVRVTPSGGRIASLGADATHFVGCRGTISIEQCSFENQLDDPLNIHGVYARISARPAPNVVEVKLNHIQQLGFRLAEADDRLEFLRNTNLLTYHEAIVASVEYLNKQFALLTFADALPADIQVGDVIGNLTWTPDVTVRGCRSRGNRARGFLITTPGRVLIEDNYFHTPGPALLIAGDANHWFESGAVRDVTVRRNTFDNCNYGVWGAGAIEFHPEIMPEHRDQKPYHRNVRIEDNTFIAFDPHIVVGWGVDGLHIRRNVIIASNDYPRPEAVADKPYNLSHCEDVVIEPMISTLDEIFGAPPAPSGATPLVTSHAVLQR